MDPVSLKVLDASHFTVGPRGGRDPIDFAALHTFGIRGIIHKATQGLRTVDPLFAERRIPARAAGHLWGAYDFNTGDPPKDQVDFFLNTVKPDSATLCALDFEDNRDSEMSLDQACEYLEYGDTCLGRRFWLYGGSRLKTLVAKADAETRAFLAKHSLWLSEYGTTMRLVDFNGHALPWPKAMLWQFSGDGIANRNIVVPGVYRGHAVDMNSFAGTDEELAAAWTA